LKQVLFNSNSRIQKKSSIYKGYFINKSFDSIKNEYLNPLIALTGYRLLTYD